MNTATIERTIEIPESREVRFTLPKTVPSGMVHVTLTFTQKKIAAHDASWVNPLLGLGKKIGSKLTVERFMQMKNDDRALEIELDERRGV